MDVKEMASDIVTTEEGGDGKPKIKNVSIEIEGRKIPLRYTTRGLIAIEDELNMDASELQDALNNMRKKNTRKVVSILRILGNEGLRLAGEKPDLTDEYMMDHIGMNELLLYRVGALAAVMKGMMMETDHTDEEKQDVVLNEILKKNTGSPAAG